MTVSVQLLSYGQAQSWLDRFPSALTTEGAEIPSDAIQRALLKAWGVMSLSDLQQRWVFPWDEDDTFPLTLSMIKRWTKAQTAALAEEGHTVSLTRLQAAWARLLGSSGWAAVPGRLATINEQRASKLAATPSLPRRQYPFDLEHFPIHELEQSLQDRLMDLGQNWVDFHILITREGVYTERRISKPGDSSWSVLTHTERRVTHLLQRSGTFDHMVPSGRGKKRPPLQPLDPALTEAMERLVFDIHQHFVPLPEAMQALLNLMELLPTDSRWPLTAIPDLAELMAGKQLTTWFPGNWQVLQDAFNAIADRHAPGFRLNPHFSSISRAWIREAFNALLYDRLDTRGAEEGFIIAECFEPRWYLDFPDHEYRFAAKKRKKGNPNYLDSLDVTHKTPRLSSLA